MMKNMTNTNLTAETVTADQIAALKLESEKADDHDMVALCALALDGDVDPSDHPFISPRLSVEWSRWDDLEGPAIAAQRCADAINAARAMEDDTLAVRS